MNKSLALFQTWVSALKYANPEDVAKSTQRWTGKSGRCRWKRAKGKHGCFGGPKWKRRG